MGNTARLSLVAAAVAAAGIAGMSPASAAAPPLVSPKWVAQHSCDPNVVVLDVRSPVGGGGNHFTYLRGHVKCAVYSNYKKAGWRVKRDGVVGMLPPVAKLQKLVRSLGIDNNDHVVIYSAGTNALDMGSATRVFWTFKVLGEDNVSIMNGGYGAYVKAKLPTARGKHQPAAGHFTARLDKRYLATEQDVDRIVRHGGAVLVDNRPHAQYVGAVRSGKDKRAGTLPGAKNIPQSWLTVNGGGTFRTAADLRKLYRYAGVPTSGKQVNFCNTGHWASLGWFVNAEILGNKDAKVYDGSMTQWTANSKLPVTQQVKLAGK